MAVPYILDAETGTSEFFSLTEDSSNTVTQSSTKKNSGTYSFRVYYGDPADRDCYGEFHTDETGLTEFYCRFYVNLSTLVGSIGSGYEFQMIWRGTSTNYLTQLFAYPISGGGYGLRWLIYDDVGNVTIYNNQVTADINSNDEFHAIELYVKRESSDGAADGVGTIWLDDIQLGTVNTIENFILMGTGADVFNFGSDNGTIQEIGDIVWYDDIKIDTSKIGLLATLEQEGFRFRNDNGTEITATWRQLQDIIDSIAKSTNVRLRVLVNATDDPADNQYQLEYKETGDGDVEYRKIQ